MARRIWRRRPRWFLIRRRRRPCHRRRRRRAPLGRTEDARRCGNVVSVAFGRFPDVTKPAARALGASTFTEFARSATTLKPLSLEHPAPPPSDPSSPEQLFSVATLDGDPARTVFPTSQSVQEPSIGREQETGLLQFFERKIGKIMFQRHAHVIDQSLRGRRPSRPQ